MRKYVNGTGAMLVVVLAGTIHAGTAGAQEAPRDTAEVIPLAPVEVTVLRTPVREDMAPFAVAALGEEELRLGRSGAFLDEAIRALPGVHVQNRYNFALGEKVIVRGFGGRAQFGVRGVRVVVDGIPATLPDGQATLDHVDVGSLGRAEVVRGPASALFGNASGGVLALESRRPAAAPVQLEAEYVGGSHGLSRIQTTASGTANGTGYLVNFSTQGWSGFRPNPLAAGGDVYGTADRIGLNAQVRRSVAGGQLAFTLNYLDLDSENPGELTRAQVEEETRTAHGAGPVNNIVRQAGKEITQTQAGLRWDGALAGLSSDVSLFGVRRSMTNPIVPFIIDLDRDALGARFHVGRTEGTPLGALRWHLGVESEAMWDDRLNFLNVNGERGNNTVDQRERVRSAGVFLQANQTLPGGAEALGGLRYDRHDFRAWDNIDRGPDEPIRTGERTMSAVSPSIGVNVPAAAGNLNVFANLGTVYETPSTTELGNRPDGEGGFNPELQPQTGVSGEIGVRGRVGQIASFELTTYRTDLRNEIVRYQIQAIPGRDFFRNAGQSRHSGAEATLAAASRDGLVNGRLTYTYTNARFRSFVMDGVEVGGNRIPGIAPQRLEGVLSINPANLFGEVVTTYVDQVPVNDQNTPGFSAPAYFLVDLRGGMREMRLGSVNVAPWMAITNLFDEYFIASIIPNAAGANPAAARYYDPGPGRSFQIGIRTGWSAGN